MARRENQSRIHQAGQTDFAAALFQDHPYASLVRETLPALPTAPSSFGLPTLPEYLPLYGIKLVRADLIRFDARPRIHGARDAARVAWEHLQYADREQVISLLLDAKGGVIGLNVVSIGDLSSAIIHPREVFKAAILANACSIILAHNHPSGDPSPSPEDIAVTRKIAQAGEILAIDLLDHVVIGNADRCTSLKERGLF